MAEQNQGQERTEQATPKRRQDARKKGDIPRSRELSTMGVMLTGTAALVLLGGSIGPKLVGVFASGFSIERSRFFETREMAVALAEQSSAALWAIAPVLIALVIAAIAGSVALGGVTFSAAAMAPKLERISPLKGLKRMFGMRALIELAKSLAKVALIIVIAVLLLQGSADRLGALPLLPIDAGLSEAMKIIAWAFLATSAALIVGAVIDVPWQLFDYSRKLKMTRQEVRDEHKEVEGRPEVRQKIRQLQQEVATRRMMESVPYADVIITNPTHFAVALRYDESRMRAPEVVAKGQDNVAARIREIGDEHRIARFEAPPLARALFHSTKVGEAIPVGLYAAVAQVLAYIFQLRDGAVDLKAPEPEVDESLYAPGVPRSIMRRGYR
ncbi:MAG: flagellar biosynthesis protein FlhB [Pseudomonadota bacterium]